MKVSRKTLRQTAGDNLAAMRYYAAMADKPSVAANGIMAALDAVANKAKRAYTHNPDGVLERTIQKDIMKALKAHPNVAWVGRFNSGSFMLEDDTGKKRVVRANTQKGMSDILGMLKGGRFFAIEVKSESGTVYGHQKAYLDLIKADGGIAGVARSVDDAIKLITQLFK